MKYSLDGLNSRLATAEGLASEPEYREEKPPKLKHKNNQSLQNTWGSNKCSKMCATGVPEPWHTVIEAEKNILRNNILKFPKCDKNKTSAHISN